MLFQLRMKEIGKMIQKQEHDVYLLEVTVKNCILSGERGNIVD